MLSPVTQEARVQFPASAIIQTNFFFLLLLQFWPLKMILTTRVYQLESNPLGCTFISRFLEYDQRIILTQNIKKFAFVPAQLCLCDKHSK